jgi:hypothetical protein
MGRRLRNLEPPDARSGRGGALWCHLPSTTGLSRESRVVIVQSSLNNAVGLPYSALGFLPSSKDESVVVPRCQGGHRSAR